MFSLIGGLITSAIGGIFTKSVGSSIASAAKGWFSARQERENLKLKSNLRIENARVDAQIKKIELDTKLYANADTESIKQWRYGYKDEVLTYSVVALIIACFVPALQPYTERGVQILNDMPMWIQVIIGGTYISVLGLRFVFLAPLAKIFGKRNK